MRAPERVLLSASFNNFGGINVASLEALSDEHFEILLRFAKVFDLTYTRFLDLQKAEVQAREAQIEAALEKIRSSSLAMHHSSEIDKVAGVLYEKLKELGLVFDGGAAIILFSEGSKDASIGVISPLNPPVFHSLPHDEEALVDNPILEDLWRAKYRGVDLINKYYPYEQKNRYFEYVFKHNDESKLPKPVREFILNAKSYTATFIAEKNSLLGANSWTEQRFSEENIVVLRRVARVFEQAYIRFLDLQKAEAQARESQIQLALERVRARTMAMHQSVELAETAQVLFHQLRELGGIPDRIAIGILDEDAGFVNFWSTDQSGTHIDQSFKARLDERKVMTKTYQAWKDHEKSLVIDLHGDDVKEWIQFAREEMGVVVKDEFIKDRRVHHFAFFSHGWILVTTHEPQAAETIEILERFASVFNLTYRRFLDLEKAEAQAREAHIEASLEKVRSSAMAMHNSNDISSTTTVVFAELKKLGIRSIRCGICLLFKESYDANVYAAATSGDGGLATLQRAIKMSDHPVLMQQYESWLKQENCVNELKGDELRSYYKLPFFKSSSNYIPSVDHGQSEWGYYIPFAEGFFYAWNDKTYSDKE
ncbi:MAG TPA: hypothetical protein VH815_06880, partial [Acidobacteriota bacterium]